MHVLKDGAAVEQYLKTTPDPELRRLLADRVQALSEYDDGIAHFYVIETAEELKALNLPSVYEIREDHTDWTELVYVISDDGFGLEVFIRKGFI
ncbi:MAG: hypothetical protein ACOYB2_19650 [Limnohabitans sp.]|jgi:hypothetical protein